MRFCPIKKNQSGFAPVFLIVCLVLLLLFFGFVFMFRRPQPISQPNKTSQVQSSNPPSAKVVTVPEVQFARYATPLIMPSAPNMATTYTLKSNYSNQEVVTFAKQLGVYTVDSTTNSVMTIYNMTDPTHRGWLQFNQATGYFSYQSYGVFKPTTSSTTPTDIAMATVDQLAIPNTALVCPITYNRTDAPTVTFVECHRDWKQLGLPIVQLAGVTNMAETQSLTTAIPGQIDQGAQSDIRIQNVSDGNNGLARPDDFNTITIGVYPDGRINSIVSHLEPIQKVTIVTSAELFSPDEVLAKFAANQAQFSLTLPAGDGTVSWQKVYPDNKAIASRADTKELVLVYLKKPTGASQAKLEPYYLLRGTAKLASGYTVRFVQALPALRSSSGIADVGATKVAGVAIALSSHRPIQIDTFSINPSATTPPVTIPPTPSASPTATRTPSTVTGAQCVAVSGIHSVLEVPGYGQLSVVSAATGTYSPHTFFYSPPDPASSVDMTAIKTAFFKAVEQQYTINVVKYLNAHPDEGLPKTKTAAETLYNKMNGIFGGGSCRRQAITPEGPPTACIIDTVNANGPAFRLSFDQAKAQQVTDAVTQTILQNPTVLQTLANQSDIFPSETIENGVLYWVFYYSFENNYVSNNNACYISGISPVIFISNDKPENISVQPTRAITYVDPALELGKWNVTTLKGHELLMPNGQKRQSLYYEYDPQQVNLDQPTDGFVVAVGQLDVFIQNALTATLGLSTEESQSLKQEVHNALVGTNKTPYLKLSFASRLQIGQQLPLKITPQPDNLYRLHVILTPLQEQASIPQPKLQPLKRKGLTVIEFGAQLSH